MSIRIATFNVENLFARYRFREGLQSLAANGFDINDLAFDICDESDKRLTAKAIKKVDADIICLQEIESLPVLDRFNSRYLGGKKYKYRMLIDSHDPRFIDVAVLSRYPITYARSHRHERNKANTAFLFSRDCLEVMVDVDGKGFLFYINHFKSMIETRPSTRARREEQAQRVAEIVDQEWGPKNYEGNFVVLGDFNDYIDPHTALGALTNHPQLVNVVDRLDEADRWTHYWAGGNEYRQLDYLLFPRPLAQKNPGSPVIMRKGLPYRAAKYTGTRFKFVGESRPKASDHAPLYLDLELL